MSANAQPTSTTVPATSNRTRSGHLVPGCRVVHVAVPERVFNHAKAQAYLSGLSWPKFIERLLSESRPIREQPV